MPGRARTRARWISGAALTHKIRSTLCFRFFSNNRGMSSATTAFPSLRYFFYKVLCAPAHQRVQNCFKPRQCRRIAKNNGAEGPRGRSFRFSPPGETLTPRRRKPRRLVPSGGALRRRAAWVGTPQARSMAPTVLLPMPIDPVRPITSISCLSARAVPARPGAHRHLRPASRQTTRQRPAAPDIKACPGHRQSDFRALPPLSTSPSAAGYRQYH